MAGDDRPEAAPLLQPESLLSPETPGPSHRKSSDSSRSSSLEYGSVSVVDDDAVRAFENDVVPETSALGRDLSWQSAYILVISRVIGSGIFATPGTIIRSVGSIGLTLLLWVVGALVAGCGLSIALEFGCMLPRSGGEKVYLEYAYRYPRFLASTYISVVVILLGFTASNCIVFSQYVLFAFGVENPSEFLRKGLAVGALTTITVIHGVFRKTGIRIQNFLGWIKVGLVIFMILSGLYVVVFRHKPTMTSSSRPAEQLRPFSDWDDLWAGSDWSWGVVATSLFKVFYSYAGLENANNVLNEVKDPVRTLRSVSITALLTACVMYLLINIAYFLVVPADDIKSSGELVAALFFRGVFGEQVGGKLLPLAVALSAFGNVMVVTFALASSPSRVKHEIARQGFLPFSEILSSTKPFGSPLGALLVHYIPSFLVITLPPSQEIYSFILEVEGYPGQITAIAVASGLIWLRFKRPEVKRPFKAWLPAVFLRIALSFSLLAAPFFPPKDNREGGLWYATYAVVGISIILFAVLYWYIWTVLIPRLRGYTIEEKTEPETFDRPVDVQPVTIHDVTGRESEFTLDGAGFQFHKYAVTEKEFSDDDQIKAGYYAETEQMLKDVTGASRVHILGHIVRKNIIDQRGSGSGSRGPLHSVHVDFSYSASLARLFLVLPDDAEKLAKGRVQIINVWRPIKQAFRHPFALAAADSVAESDLVPIPIVFPTHKGETLGVRHNPGTRWFYKYGLKPDEVVLFKIFDTKTDGRARRVPHSAFVDPETEDFPARESIEIRTFVFHEYDTE
ncbi:hypothetical protein GQ53DRAFT_792333 [Thozetella sp. PMI_491]|nr:hypothetical protein GQ53DRAFT_792333 [Thozetella sp. PMI_491]